MVILCLPLAIRVCPRGVYAVKLQLGSSPSTRWPDNFGALSKICYNAGFGNEQAMTTHSNILAWKFPGAEEPSRLQYTGSHRVGQE